MYVGEECNGVWISVKTWINGGDCMGHPARVENDILDTDM